ncbi:MAG: hypothetical protein AB7T49_16360 [Oligoflexales bacterium]
MYRYIVLSFALVACKTSRSFTKDTSSVVEDKWVMAEDLEKDIGKVGCQGGESEIRLALKAVTNLPQANETPFPGWNNVGSIGQQNDHNVRLDTCYNEVSGEISLRRIVQRLQENVYIIMSVKSDAVVEGLLEAMMGDFSTLKIVNRYSEWFFETVDNRIVIQAFKAGESSLVGVVNEKKKDEGYIPYSASLAAKEIVVGTLEPMFDPFSGTTCSSTLEHVFVEVEQARIEISYCPMAGTSGGWGAEYTEIAVIDNQDFLPADVKGKRIVVTEKEEIGHHHNICESLKLKTPHAEYVFTSGPAGVPEDATASVCTSESEVFLKNPKPPKGPWNMIYKINYTGKGNPLSLEGTSDLEHWGKGNNNKFEPSGGGNVGPGVGGPGIEGPDMGI